MRTIAFALAAASLLAAPAAATRSTPGFTSLTVLGDSLVDAGNVFSLTAGGTPSDQQGYVGGRYTNGLDYTDLLSQALFGTPTLASRDGGRNFAYGAGRLVTNAGSRLDLDAQIAEATAGAIDPNGLYVLNFGGDDIIAAATGNYDTATYKTADDYLDAAAANYANGIRTLSEAGVRNIFFTDFPVAGNSLNDTANADLAAAIAGLHLSPDTTLYQYSLSGFAGRVYGDPAAYGVDPAKLSSNCVADGAQLGGCEGYFSFDGLHPTAAIQEAAFRDIDGRFHLTATRAAVPEPGTWALAIGGVGLLGGALRRRRRAAAKVSVRAVPRSA